MRLSTEPDRDEANGVAVIHAACAAGVTLLDTADAYCRDDSETGHNERLIARALATWAGDRRAVTIASKGGLTRPGGQWVPDGRAKSLIRACERSLRALDTARIDLYQLHAPDPRTPLATSVRALDALRRDNLVGAIGLCNVTLAQIEEARRIAEIASVQVEVSLWHDASVLSGVLDYCARHTIPLLAYRPLGGSGQRRRVAHDPALLEIAARHGVTPFEVALAALASLSPVIVPLPGATRTESAASLARARRLTLTDADRDHLARRFPIFAALKFREAARIAVAPSSMDSGAAGASETPGGEIVMIMGLPASGKSTVARELVDAGYMRLNRDAAGGSLRKLLPALDAALASGASRVVLDNTYVTRASRAAVIQAAWRRRMPVRGIWLATSIEDAQINAASRILARYGRLLSPDELRAASRTDVAAFAPTVQFRYQRELEPPQADEGFTTLETRPFERRRDPSFTNRAVIVWIDGVLQRSRSGRRAPSSPDDAEVIAERGDTLRRYAADGWTLLGMSWLPEIAEGTMSTADADAVFAYLRARLGVAIDIEYCPHGGGPPACWCRKPMPGLGVVLVQRHALDPAQCLYVGAGAQDPGFARKLGFAYREPDEFFR